MTPWIFSFVFHVPIWISMASAAQKPAKVNPEARLIEYLLDDSYNRHARPTSNIRKPIDVTISLYITKILNLDEKNQVLTTFGWLEVHWTDEFLTWVPHEHSNISRIIVPPTEIWLPDFGLENSADAIYDDQADKRFRAGIDHDGSVQWVPGGKFITSCQLDITLYPFDSQCCEMDFVDWTYDGRFVNLINGTNYIGLDVYKKHGEWDIIRTNAMKLDQYFDSDPGIPFPTVKFILHLKRKPRFYMINVVAPCILMSILALMVFYLPPDSGEKVSLGITVLLSFSVFLLLIAENVPKTSEYVPLIGIYLTMVMVMTAVSIVISVIVLDLHHHEPTNYVPRWLRHLVFGCMARVLCIYTPYRARMRGGGANGLSRSKKGGSDYMTRSASRYNGTSMTSQRKRDKCTRHASLLSNQQRFSEDEEVVLKSAETNGIDGVNLAVQYLCEHDIESKVTRMQTSALEEILCHLRSFSAKMKSNSQRDSIKEEWQMLAKIIDRFLLVIFLLAISSLTLSILYIYPQVSMNMHQCTR